MGWKEAINTYPSSIVYEIHGEDQKILDFVLFRGLQYILVIVSLLRYTVPVYLTSIKLLKKKSTFA
jgi:hypothetical protein